MVEGVTPPPGLDNLSTYERTAYSTEEIRGNLPSRSFWCSPEGKPWFPSFELPKEGILRNSGGINNLAGQLVFGRDMILPIQFKADWTRIAQRKQQSINDSNYRENQRRLAHQYKVHDKVLLEKPGIIPKMSQPRNGPYEVIGVTDLRVYEPLLRVRPRRPRSLKNTS